MFNKKNTIYFIIILLTLSMFSFTGCGKSGNIRVYELKEGKWNLIFERKQAGNWCVYSKDNCVVVERNQFSKASSSFVEEAFVFNGTVRYIHE